jgi:2-polyprenyl-3-methyl-5-hydroxy-6-metoxy-1,4-benzoquinol methylase
VSASALGDDDDAKALKIAQERAASRPWYSTLGDRIARLARASAIVARAVLSPKAADALVGPAKDVRAPDALVQQALAEKRSPQATEPAHAFLPLDRTIEAYRSRVLTAIANWSRFKRPSKFFRRFVKILPRGAKVLDYGCGIGMNLARFKRKGFETEGIDGTRAFVSEARRRVPGVPIKAARFENVTLPSSHYDGIWSEAALMHVPKEELRRQLVKLWNALKAGGFLGITLPWGRSKRYTRGDWIPGRYIASYKKKEALSLFRKGRVSDCRIVSGDGRKGRWIQILALKDAGQTLSFLTRSRRRSAAFAMWVWERPYFAKSCSGVPDSA